MSKNNVEKTIRRELNRLNEIIDEKIIRGLSYRREAEKHSILRVKLSALNRSRFFYSNWLPKSLGFMSAFFL